MSISVPEPTPARPRPVLIAGLAVAVVEAIVALVAAILSWDPVVAAQALGLVGAFGSLIATFIAQRFVTPLSSPHDNEGRELHPSWTD